MQVVILYESLTGNTERAARLIANAFYERQVAARVFPVDAYDAEALAEADLVVAGTWTDGFFVVAQKPAKRKKFHQLPDLGGRRCAVFCTYALNSGHTLDKLTAVLTERNADVLGGLAIRRDQLGSGAVDFVSRVLDVVSA
jgi:flavodoxin